MSSKNLKLKKNNTTIYFSGAHNIANILNLENGDELEIVDINKKKKTVVLRVIEDE